ncbi:MAG: Hpt domain-containing protein [Acidobacteriota bacterium]
MADADTDGRDLRILDPTYLAEAVGGDQDATNRMVGIFLHELSLQIEKLRDAAAAGDVESMSRIAHAFKGSAGQLGGERLSDLARHVELAAKEGQVEVCRETIARFDAEFEALKRALAETDWEKEARELA